MRATLTFRHDIEHAVRHRLLMVRLHARHEAKVEESYPPIRQSEQVSLVRVAVNETVGHQLHRQAAHGRLRERLAGVGLEISWWNTVDPLGDEDACRAELLPHRRHHHP